MSEKLKSIIEKWLKCEITGDEGMSQIFEILNEEEKSKNEINE